jgi:glycogen phosphorylase
VTNGVTPRRWLMQANPRLSELIDSKIGKAWRRDTGLLIQLRKHCSDPELGRAFLAVKRLAKQKLAARIERGLGISIDPSSLYAVQIKRIHEYKRQLLNLLHVISRYHAIINQHSDAYSAGFVPRTVIIAGKAASAYHTAKLIIQLAHDVAQKVNNDPRVGNRLKVVFMPNYGVSLAELIIPAADLSEQISTAGTEASGTGNMKFALNGACTIGTWDGANIEMAEGIGKENFFEFGLKSEAVSELAKSGYDPNYYARQNQTLKAVLDALHDGQFSPEEPTRYRGLVATLLNQDKYFLLADFAAYLSAQAEVDQLFEKPGAWAECALRNIAGMGNFSVDRTVSEYLERVWSPGAVMNLRSSI